MASASDTLSALSNDDFALVLFAWKQHNEAIQYLDRCETTMRDDDATEMACDTDVDVHD